MRMKRKTKKMRRMESRVTIKCNIWFVASGLFCVIG